MLDFKILRAKASRAYNQSVSPLFILWVAKLTSLIIRLFNRGSGTALPGLIALKLDPQTLAKFLSQIKKGFILVTGTNGKTTTASLIEAVLSAKDYQMIHNSSGSNLLRGIVSTFIDQSDWRGRIKADFAVLEVDELALAPLLWEFGKIPNSNQLLQLTIVFTNLFRDQLDRYGEVNAVAQQWLTALRDFNPKAIDSTRLVINADDPELYWLGIRAGPGATLSETFFGLDNTNYRISKLPHAVDSIFCPQCNSRLNYQGVYLSHLGEWQCLSCGLNPRGTPKIVLSVSEELALKGTHLQGVYNFYNITAAWSVVSTMGVDWNGFLIALKGFQPQFGRQEEFLIEGKKIKIFLSKNPTGFNESIRTIIGNSKEKSLNVLIVLNDLIADGRDVSWIWDVDFEDLMPFIKNLTISGRRAYDLALRIKYTQKENLWPKEWTIENNLEKAIRISLDKLKDGETLYVLPTYTAMLEVRKILGGKAIL